jgi:hypothetical protein
MTLASDARVWAITLLAFGFCISLTHFLILRAIRWGFTWRNAYWSAISGMCLAGLYQTVLDSDVAMKSVVLVAGIISVVAIGFLLLKQQVASKSMYMLLVIVCLLSLVLGGILGTLSTGYILEYYFNIIYF